MNRRSASSRAALGAYRALLALLPPEFRRRYGADMVDLLARRMGEAPTRGERVGIWLASVWDLLVESAAERTRGDVTGGRGDRRGGTTVESFLLDARQGVRSLFRTPGFTAIAVLTIALGIGATTSIFSVVNGVLLRPLAFAEPDRLAMVWMDNQRMGIRTDITSWPNFEDWGRDNRTFSGMAGFIPVRNNLAGEQEPERVSGALVSQEFFDVMGVRPVLGRTFIASEMEVGGARVGIISHGVWTRWYGQASSALGSTMKLDGTDVEIVGVMPEGFAFPDGATVWTPLALDEGTRQARSAFFLYVVGRLDDGASLASAQSDMDAIAASISGEFPQAAEGMGVYVQPLHEYMSGSLRTSVLVLFGAVGLVLLIACANVANLLLSRSLSRQHETATRAALGAQRGRLLRQSLTESLALALLGGALGVGLAYGGVELLRATAPADLPRLDDIELNGVVLAFALGLSVLTGLIFGAAPALQGSAKDITSSLRDESRGTVGARSGWRMRGVLIVSELALSLVLLVGAGLLAQSFVRLANVDSRFDRTGVLTARVSLEGPDMDADAIRAFYAQLLERLQGLPEVRTAALGSAVNIPLLANSGGIAVEGQPLEPDASRVEVTIDRVSPEYFSATGTPLLLGREFTDADRADAPLVAIVNESMVRRYWPNENPLGKRFTFGDGGDGASWMTVVGVAPDWRRYSPEVAARPSAYVPFDQRPTSSMLVFLRTTSGDPLASVGALRAAVREIDAAQAVSEISTLEELLGERIAQRRLVTLVASLFAVVAVLLALVGVYGVLSYSVAQSTKEIGVRIALGGDVFQVLGMVYRRVGALVGVGLALGVGGALLATRALAPLLYEVGSLDPVTFVAAPMLLGLVALFACWVPARRATRVDPAVALRSEG